MRISYGFFPYSAAADNHGDQGDPWAVSEFHRFNELYKPKVRIHKGDNWDFRSLRGKASSEERRESLLADLEAGHDFLMRFRPTHFLQGNHDERIWILAKLNNGPASDFAKREVARIENVFEKLGCEVHGYNIREGLLQVGNSQQRWCHGFWSGHAGVFKMANVYGNTSCGHGHSIYRIPAEREDGAVGRMTGSLCKQAPEYMGKFSANFRWQLGFEFGEIHRKSGEVRVFQAERIGSRMFAPGVMD